MLCPSVREVLLQPGVGACGKFAASAGGRADPRLPEIQLLGWDFPCLAAKKFVAVELDLVFSSDSQGRTTPVSLLSVHLMCILN